MLWASVFLGSGMRFLRRSLSGVFLLSLVAGLLALAGNQIYGALQERWNQETRERPARERIFAVNVVMFEPTDVAPELQTFGEIRSRRTLELRASAGGEVIWLSDAFEEGGTVTAGDVLARIDPLDAQGALDTALADLAEAEADRKDAERSLVLARDELSAAEDQAALRDRALERQKDLLERGVGTEAAVETAELSASSAWQAVLSRRQAEAQAEARLDQAGTMVSRRTISVAEAERRLADTEITADISGVLSGANLVEGRLVSANENLGEIVDPGALEVSFRVSTAQYARLLDDTGRLLGLDITVALDAFGVDLTASGKVSRESAAVATGQTGRLLFARLDDAPGFRPGDFVTVRIAEPVLNRVALLPATAVDASGQVLIVGEDDRLQTANVQVLRRQGNDVIVRARGLAGNQIVAERTPFLGAGIRVRPISPGGAEAEPEGPAMVALEPERRARIKAFVENNNRMPAEAKARILAQLENEEVPAQMVERIESRMGG